jgi:MSHA biogenesis protein MshO
MRRARGFTLVELVVTIAVSAIVLVFAGMFIQAPFDAYIASTARAEIQDSLGIAWPRMERDIQSALPNSVRINQNGTVWALELLPVMESARFMSTPGPGSFNTAGYFRTVSLTHTAASPATLAPGTFYLSINNQPPNNAYALTNVMTPANRTIAFSGNIGADEDRISITPAFTFAAGASKRIYLVTRPVTYLCNPAAGTLQRFSGYTIAASQTSRRTAAQLTAAGATASLVARDITSCNFSQLPANAVHGQIVTIRITAMRDGETTSILHRVAVEKLQ